MLTTPATHPLTRRAMAMWARWRNGNASQRRHEEAGLHPDEIAGMRQLLANLEQAGEPLKWFGFSGGSSSATLLLKVPLFTGLRIEPAAVGDVRRACEAMGVMPFGGPAAIDRAVRELAKVGQRPQIGLHPEGLITSREETEMSVAANGAGPRWKAGRDAFEAFVAAARELKIDLNAPGPGETEKLALKAGYSRTYLYTVQQDLRNGRLSDRVPPAPLEKRPEAPKAVPAELCEDEITAPTPSVALPDAGLVAQLAQVTAERDAALSRLELAKAKRDEANQEGEEDRSTLSDIRLVLEGYTSADLSLVETIERLVEEVKEARSAVPLTQQPRQPTASEEPMVPQRLVSEAIDLMPQLVQARLDLREAELKNQGVENRMGALLREMELPTAA